MRFSTLQEWLDWQETLHPSEMDLGLERVRRVWNAMGGDISNSQVITIAGTNGKGSSAALLESILLAGGYRVGCYTSPHLLRYNERIRVNGQEVFDQDICNSFQTVDQARKETSITYFEFGTLAALDIFRHANLDVVVLEVGLGGRLDAVNIIDPDVALITTIDIDHTKWLGDTREQIALEKAGILRTRKPGVFSAEDPPVSLIQRANELDADLRVAGKDFRFTRSDNDWNWQGRNTSWSNLPSPGISGEFIYQNASGVLMALELLDEKLPITPDAIRSGLVNVMLPGRFQVLSGEVTIVIDVAHNPEAARELAKNLKRSSADSRTVAVFSAMEDKDISGVVAPMLNLVDHWYIGQLGTTRGARNEQMMQELIKNGVDATDIDAIETISDAMTKAMAEVHTRDRLVVFGSFYTVAEILRHPGIVNRTTTDLGETGG